MGQFDVITVAISGVNVSILEGSFQLQDAVEQRSTLNFNVLDATGAASYPYGSQVTITSALHGLLYTGLVYKDDDTNLFPNVHRVHKITCMDNHYFADKRYFRKTDYTNMLAGDILCDLLNTYLAAEGISALYAYRPDNTQVALAQGTLTNVISLATDLELLPAGTTFSQTESTPTDWNNGTLYQTAVINNALYLQQYSGLKLAGTAQQGINNNYCYIKIWAGAVAVASGDNLEYAIWIPSTNKQPVGGVDIIFSDGTTMRDTHIVDQNGLDCHPGTDLSGFALDTRYYRTIDLTSLAGKTIQSVQLALEGDTPGDYAVYFDTITLYSVMGLKQTFFNAGSVQTVVQLDLSGYTNIALTYIDMHESSGNRISASYSIGAPIIAQNSLISWQFAMTAPPPTSTTTTGTATATPPPTTGANSIPYVLVESSLDSGATWQTCTNHGPIPNLLPGQNVAGDTIMLRETLNCAGPDPTNVPYLIGVEVTIQSAYNTTKTDASASYDTTGDWNTGTLSNLLSPNNDLTLYGYSRSYQYAVVDLSNSTVFGTSPTAQPYAGSAALRCSPVGDIRLRLDWASSWSDFTFECDVLLVDAVGNYGMVYRCTGWGNGQDSYAYNAYINSAGISLAHGSNTSSGAGTYTLIQSYGVALATNTWYRFKVVVSGNNHKVYVNDVLYINVSDATYTAGGNIGLRHYNDGGARHSGFFKNVGILGTTSGTWTSPNISLNSVGTVGSSVIAWNATVPTNSTLIVQTSIDNGASWQTATNNMPVPSLSAGQNVAGKNLKIKLSLSTNNASQTPDVLGVSVYVSAQYSASGSRVSPALSVASVGRANNASVTWSAIVPTSTTLLVDTSTNGSTWTNIGSGASGSAAISGLSVQGAITQDIFAVDSHTNYTQTTATGGSGATWAWDTTNSRVTAAGGSKAQLLYTGLSATDVDLFTHMDASDTGGLTWRRVDANNCYELSVQDGSSSATHNTCVLYKTSGGTRSSLATGAITFTRGTYHLIRVTMLGGVITVLFDGNQVISYTDGSPLAAGGAGLRTDGGNAHFYQFWFLPLGQSLAGLSVYTRVRLSTTDPTVTVQLQSLITSVHNASIGAGVMISATNYQNNNTLAACIDDLAKRADWTWYIDKNKQLYANVRNATPAPFVIQASDDVNTTFLASSIPVVSNSSPLYRNRSVILGGLDVVSPPPETRIGDGETQSWVMGYPLAAVPTITLSNPAIGLNGQVATVGILNVDSGKQFYYNPGSNVITQDRALLPPGPTETITFTYIGQKAVVAQYDDTAEQTAYAALEGGSGIVEVVESVPTLNYTSALAYAQAQVAKYKVRARTLTFQTLKYGLAPGQLASVFLPQNKIQNGQFLITKVSTVFRTTSDGTELAWYTIEATEGPVVGTWARLFVKQGN